MFLQEFIRGMRNLTIDDAQRVLDEGMQCQALRADPTRQIWDIERDLTDVNLDRHRHDHDAFGPTSPYISTTTGTIREYNVEDSAGEIIAGYNKSLFAFDTALAFAVLDKRSDGWIFYGYHFLLGRPAGRHAEFAEEVRDFHQHPQWSRYRGEGEVAAAIRIPPRRLRCAEYYRYDWVRAAIDQKSTIEPADVIDNLAYVEPDVLLAPRTVI